MLYIFQTIAALLIHSRWITAVGGTQIDKDNHVNDPETAAEWGWSGISSGGGFSYIYERPRYQKSAVEEYFEASNNASDVS